MNVASPTYLVLYNGKDISEDVSHSLISLNYEDKVSGEADELEITLEDKMGRWQNDWYPQKGAYLTVNIGISGKNLDCGVFQIDEIEFTGPPDQITIKALSTGFYGKLRTRKGYAHENKTLSEIIRSIAAKIKYNVIGNIENIRIGRSTQNRETDLQFIHRLASNYGYNFTIKGKNLIFIKQTELEARNTSLSIDKTQVTSWGFKDKTSQIFKGTEIKFHNPNANEVIRSVRPASFIDQEEDYSSQLDTLELRGKVENEEQANVIASALIHKTVSLQQTGSFETTGNVLLVSGNNIDLTGFGALSGIWHILTSTHNLSASGFTTSVEIKRINISSSPTKKISKSKAPVTTYKVK
ncbi:phage late control D family protein [Pedobacter sp. Hv1]|uniref:phage late control D family protein n=1 Tax=Pedobacter sp. Hv1 TaxID=1740090 RepID=UPI0006D8C244|nr:contractile injection system protein, VgrG/Pvc8 family [Pedobacter sp. Hv1]KQC02102.1 hypothetical protein AQF98_00575 [Pedobacter sp. Hv1]